MSYEAKMQASAAKTAKYEAKMKASALKTASYEAKMKAQQELPCDWCDPRNLKCICKICTCGKHKCPPKLSQNKCRFEGQSSYNVDFTKKQAPAARLAKQKPKEWKKTKFEGVSTYTAKYGNSFIHSFTRPIYK